MTTLEDQDREASSPNGRFTVEARTQRAFRYRLLEHVGAEPRVVWERWQGEGENGPHELLVSDGGWSILRTHGYNPEVIAVSPAGHEVLRVLVGNQRLPSGPHPVRTDAWPMKSRGFLFGGRGWEWLYSWPYFFQRESTDFFAWRTSWGQRLVLDLTHGALLPEESPAQTALSHAMAEEEQRGAYRLLLNLTAQLYEVRETLARRADTAAEQAHPLRLQLRRVPLAFQLVGLHHLQEALPLLRFWERVDHPGSSTSCPAMGAGWTMEAQAFRPLIHHALRRLGADPQGYATYHLRVGNQARLAVPEHVAHRRERAAELHPGMSAEQVLQRVGSPDHVRQRSRRVGKVYRTTEEWEYDFRSADAWMTLRLSWEEDTPRGQLTTLQELPAYWLQSLERGLEPEERGLELEERPPEQKAEPVEAARPRPPTAVPPRRDRTGSFEALLSAPHWQPFIHLINGWFRQPLAAETGVPAEELAERERASRRPMPALLREWYLLFGGHESFGGRKSNDYEMPLARVWESARYLRIYGENQDGWYCGILNEHLALPDPPVYFDSKAMPVSDLDLDFSPDTLVDGHFLPVCDRLSDFLLGVAVRQITLRMEPSPFLRAGVGGAYFPEILGVDLELRGLFDFPDGYSPFLGKDLLALSGWGFTVRTPEALARVEQAARASGCPVEDSSLWWVE